MRYLPGCFYILGSVCFIVGTLLTSVPASAQQQCYAPEVIQEAGEHAGLTLITTVEGQKLAEFNASYERDFHHEAPDVDLLLVFQNQDPEGQMVWIAPFKSGCLMAQPVPMSLEIFDKLSHGGQPL